MHGSHLELHKYGAVHYAKHEPVNADDGWQLPIKGKLQPCGRCLMTLSKSQRVISGKVSCNDSHHLARRKRHANSARSFASYLRTLACFGQPVRRVEARRGGRQVQALEMDQAHSFLYKSQHLGYDTCAVRASRSEHESNVGREARDSPRSPAGRGALARLTARSAAAMLRL